MLEIDKETVIRNIKEYVKKYQPSRKMLFLLFLAGWGIGFVSVPQVVNQEWAWQVAGSMITINGLIIGFSILGLTVFLRRGYSENLFKKLVEESADNFLTDLKHLGKNQKEISPEELTEKILSNVLHPFIDIEYFRGVILVSMELSLISIGFCLSLFGVTPERISNPLLGPLYYAFYSLAISMFIWSAYYIVHGISSIVERSTEISTEQGFRIALEIFKRKLGFAKESRDKTK